MENKIILDVQGFQGSTFIAKELAWITVDQEIEEISTIVFKPPYSWESQSLHYQRVNKTVIDTCHKIPWNDGKMPYEKLTQVIDKAVADKKIIYVKGLEKKRWLENIIKSKIVIDLENLDCPSLKRLQDYNSHFCSNHGKFSNRYSCASENAKILKEWYIKNCCGYPSLDKSLELFFKLNIENMKTEDIAVLPKHFILAYAADKINCIWSRLPAILQDDKDIIKYKHCNKHNKPTVEDYDELINDITFMLKIVHYTKNYY